MILIPSSGQHVQTPHHSFMGAMNQDFVIWTTWILISTLASYEVVKALSLFGGQHLVVLSAETSSSWARGRETDKTWTCSFMKSSGRSYVALCLYSTKKTLWNPEDEGEEQHTCSSDDLLQILRNVCCSSLNTSSSEAPWFYKHFTISYAHLDVVFNLGWSMLDGFVFYKITLMFILVKNKLIKCTLFIPLRGNSDVLSLLRLKTLYSERTSCSGLFSLMRGINKAVLITIKEYYIKM